MRILDIRERAVAISRYADPAIPSGGLTTSIVAIRTDAVRDGRPVIGYGFASIGRFAQGGLIRERFAPRLLAAEPREIASADGSNIDPFRAWAVMMRGEKPGGHGERCVAVGTLDMALWDAAAKIAGLPLNRFLAGYHYPNDDIARLGDELRHFVDQGYTHAKIKIGAVPLAQELRRIEAAAGVLSAERLAVDAMNTYGPADAQAAAAALAPLGLWWFEDICDPLDFATQAGIAARYAPPIAAGEALFSAAEASLLLQYGGLRRGHDILLFDPVHCYGLPGFLRIIERFEAAGWPRASFWPHGGHLFCLHLVSALGLGGAEVNPASFAPFGGLADAVRPDNGRVAPPNLPGIGFEAKSELYRLFAELTEG
jgi:D(-)-tartrate dehydratase